MHHLHTCVHVSRKRVWSTCICICYTYVSAYVVYVLLLDVETIKSIAYVFFYILKSSMIRLTELSYHVTGI